MNSTYLDELDRTILGFLQRDARNHTATDIAEETEVTDATVRNRIHRLEEEEGIIDEFVPVIDYEQAGYGLKMVIICTAPVSERQDLVEKAKDLEAVTFVRELMTGKRNVQVTVVASDREEITEIANRLNDIGLTIEAEEQVIRDCFRPFGDFQADVTAE
jgi:Lrp/AsnC family leucine-responsive transcriptional regulator